MPAPETSTEIIGRRHVEWREHQLPLAVDARLPRRGRAVSPGRLRLRPPRPAGPQPDPPQARVSRPARAAGRDRRTSRARAPASPELGRGPATRRPRPPTTTTSCGGPGRRSRRSSPRRSRPTSRGSTPARSSGSGPPRLDGWWADVDGCGTTIDQWMTETVAPLLLVLGQLDLSSTIPPPPTGSRSRPGPTSSGWGSTAASPRTSSPRTCSGGGSTRPGSATPSAWSSSTTRPTTGADARYRHWTDDGVDPLRRGRRGPRGHARTRSAACRSSGSSTAASRGARTSASRGTRASPSGSASTTTATRELILSDTTQAHPLLQGPEDFVQADGTIPIGPSWLLPKKKNTQGGSATYEGFEVVDFPKDGAESIRKNKADIRDDVDRDSALVTPDGPRRRGAVGPVEGDGPRRRQQPPGQDRQGPGPGRARSPPSWRWTSSATAAARAGTRRDRDRLPDRVRPVHGERRGRASRRVPGARRRSRALAGHRGPHARPADAALPARPGRRPVRRVRRRDRAALKSLTTSRQSCCRTNRPGRASESRLRNLRRDGRKWPHSHHVRAADVGRPQDDPETRTHGRSSR